MEQHTQFSLELPFDAPSEVSSQHSIRTIKKQKIKNFGLLGRKISETENGDANWNARAQQVLGRFTSDTPALFRKLADRLALQEEKEKGGAWDWKSWGEKFHQLLLYRRFIPHPLLLTSADVTDFPRAWAFAPRDDRGALIEGLQELRQARAFAGLRFHVDRFASRDAFGAFRDFAASLDTYFAKGPKPYPELEAVVPAHDESLRAFFGMTNSEKRQCRRSLAVVLPEGLAANPLVYEPVLRDLHARLRTESEFHASVQFGPEKLPETSSLWLERPLAGAINIAEFVDPTTGKFLWEELCSALATSLRLVVNWGLASGGDSNVVFARQPWIGLTGWNDALAKLELEYEDPRSVQLAERMMELLSAELEEAERRLETQKNLERGALKLALRPTHSRFIAQVAAVRAGVMPEGPAGREEQILAMQSAFHGGARGTFALPNPGRLEADRFVELLTLAATSGWQGVRFV